jgi:hypothetical protein
MVYCNGFFLNNDAFPIVVSLGKRCTYIQIKWNKIKNNATFKGKQRDNVKNSKPPPQLSIAAVEISSPIPLVEMNSMERKSYDLCPKLRSRIHPQETHSIWCEIKGVKEYEKVAGLNFLLLKGQSAV